MDHDAVAAPELRVSRAFVNRAALKLAASDSKLKCEGHLGDLRRDALALLSSDL